MADLTLANAILEVRRRINESTANVFTDAEITEWLHRGARNISVITLCNPVTKRATLTENAEQHSISTSPGTNFVRVTALLRTNRDGTTEEEGLQRIHPRQVGQVQIGTPDTPKFWFDWRGDGDLDYAYVFPTPSATAAIGTSSIIAHGYIIVDDYGNGDTLPDWANNLAVLYAVACAYIKEGKHAKASMEIQRYMNAIVNARRILYESNQIPDTADMRKIPDTKVYPERQ